jgi:hypothetical protein
LLPLLHEHFLPSRTGQQPSLVGSSKVLRILLVRCPESAKAAAENGAHANQIRRVEPVSALQLSRC